MTDPTGPAPSLLVVVAHPDDESITCGGLLALCSAAAIPTTLLCLTRGGLGHVDDPARVRMGDLREQELGGAARVLGLGNVILRDHRNGFLPWVERNVIEADITQVLQQERPSVVVTFDHDGLYWHPDHIVVHERTRAAVSALGPDGPALYYAQMPKGAMRKAWQAASRSAEERGDLESVRPFAFGIEVDAFGLFTAPATLCLDVAAVAVQKLRAIRCHTSQLSGDVLARLPEEAAADTLGVELYRRAEVGRQCETFLDRFGRPV